MRLWTIQPEEVWETLQATGSYVCDPNHPHVFSWMDKYTWLADQMEKKIGSRPEGVTLDMLEILGKYVCDLHIKDGLWPTDGWNLGREVKVGEGKADFPRIIRMLKELGYDGALTIEREIDGEEQIRDIIDTKLYLEKLLTE